MSATPAPPSSEEIRCLARRAAEDLGIPLSQVNLLRLAYWLASQSEDFAKEMQ